VPDGPDVAQLEQNLTALGYASTSSLTVDEHFTSATSEAIRRWQRATGQLVTGQVQLGAVVYEPGPIRVSSVQAGLGQLVRDGDPVMTATSTTAVVSVPVPAAQSYLVHVADAVTVTLPSGTTTPGTVEAISTAANLPTSPGNGSQSGPAQATIPALVALTAPTTVANLDQAPVTVNITSQAVTNVLAVPITALVALAGGGYGVYTVTPGARTLVAVTPGLFATTLVQVTSAALHAGDTVEVPAA
jgi:peptidoglycan hydrolase-like protein with peptidoglycan-binding domain